MAVFTGTPGDDSLIGTNGGDLLDGGDGADGLRGRGGNDTLYGGTGDDFLNGGLGDDIIDGGTGYDRAAFYTDATGGVTVDLNLQGIAQNTGQGWDTLIGIENVSGSSYGDTLIGDDGDNWLWGSGATLGDGSISAFNNDTLIGNGGNDLLTVGVGNHTLSGGSGNDSVRFTENGAAETGLVLSLANQGVAQVSGNGSWTLTGIENLSGSIADDTLTGDGGDNVLAGDTGNDTLIGGDGNDILYGDGRIDVDTHGTGGSGPITTFTDITTIDPSLVAGNDLLEGGLGNDVLNGGNGVDTATYAHAAGGVIVDLGGGSTSGAEGLDTLISIENATGSEFDDELYGNGGDNVLQGLGGNDFVQGRAGNDTIYGGDGDDNLLGDIGENFLGYGGNDVIYGGNGNDILRGGLGNDQLYGGANNDLLRGNGGVDYFDGGADDGLGYNGIGDRVSFYDRRATQGAVADLRTGIISNDGSGNVETMVNIESLGADTAYVDTFYGNDSANFIGGGRGDNLYGFGGDDYFQTGAAAGIIDGGSGVDLLTLDSSGGWLRPDETGDGLAEQAAAATSGWAVNLTTGTMRDGDGNVGTLTGIENVDGSQLGDTITGDANANVLNGLDGDDTLEGGGGNDSLDGGNGIDTASYAHALGGVTVDLYAGTAAGADGNDILANIENAIGSAYADVLLGTDSANRLEGGEGDDALYGFGGNDALVGGGGNDFLKGGFGDDSIVGGAGYDRASYYQANAALGGVTVSLLLQDQAQYVGSQGWDTLSGIENVSGTPFADTLTGDANDNWLWGSGSWIGSAQTAANNDVIDGGAGNDLIEVGFGNHALTGGAGADTLLYSENGSPEVGVTISLALQGAAQNTSAGSWTLNGFENLAGGTGSDLLTGDGNANIIAGGDGNDQLIGGAGNDSLYGDGYYGITGSGSGTYFLGADADVANGAVGGTDTLEGGLGDDLINGGIGIDTASYANATGGVTVSVVTGLASGADGNDTLVNIENLTGSNYADTLTGNLGSNLISAGGGNDFINATQGIDVVDGGSGGRDQLVVTTGNSSLFAAATGARTYTIGANSIVDSSGTLNTSFTGVERIVLSTVGNGNFNDTIDASGFVTTNSLALDLRLGNGNNTVVGTGGNDQINTGLGRTTADGGTGNDTAWVNIDASNPTTILITSSGGTVNTSANGLVSNFTNFETVLVGGVGAGTVTLDASGYTAVPGINLFLLGHNGSDIMIGSAGNDFFANATGQVLGNDVYTGNGGADIYDYTYAADSINGDTITDFDIDDNIDLRFNNLEAGGSSVLANHFIGAAAFSGVAGEYRYQIDGTQTLVQVDSNGDKIADQTLTISNGAFSLAETFAGSNILTLAAVIDPLLGVVADGYIQGATLFVDTNGNKLLDAGEAWTITGPGGGFHFNVNQAGTIVAVGGTNLDTGLANTMVLSAPSDSEVINPLTTLVQAVIDKSGGVTTVAQAEAKVLAALGLSPTLDLLTYDLLAHGNDATALAAQKAAAMVVTLVAEAEAAAGSNGTTETKLIGALAGLIVSTAPGATIDLTSAATLTPLLTTAGVINPTSVAGEVAIESETIANATSLTTIAAAQVTAATIDYSMPNTFNGDGSDNHFSGLGGDDTLYGNGGNDRLEGGIGNDLIYGGSGDDLLDGGAGNDLLDGGTGNDRMVGGSGNDLYIVDSAGDVVVELTNEGYDTLRSSVSYTLGDNVERLELTGSALDGAGNALDNYLLGNGLSNHLDGGAGNDILLGDAGLDYLRGGAGNDRLVGGDGKDYMTGGTGNDTFVAELGSLTVTKLGNLSLDVIFDFSAGDKIDLTGIDAMSGVAGFQHFNFIGSNANKSAGDLSFKVYDSVMGAEKALGIDIDGVAGASPYGGPVTIVYGNHDGGAPDFALALLGVNGIDQTAFLNG